MAIEISDAKTDYTTSMDLRGKPTKVCVCGCDVWKLLVKWDDDDTIGMYFLDMECLECGSKATAPTPDTNYQGDICQYMNSNATTVK